MSNYRYRSEREIEDAETDDGSAYEPPAPWTTVPASSYADSEAPTHPLVVVTPLMRSALDNGVEPADLEQWACAGGDDNRRAREAARLMGGA